MSEHDEHTPTAGETAAPKETEATSQAAVETEATGEQPEQDASNLTHGGDASETGAETPADQGDTDQPKKESRAKERIQELVSRAKEAESRAAEAERLLSEYQSEDLKPSSEYETDEEYQRALIRAELTEAERARARREQEAAAKRAQEERQRLWEARADEAKARIPDFEQVAYSQSVPYSQSMLQIVQESEQGPEIAYHLGKNPHEADRIARLSPLEAAREIGRLESRFAASAPKKVSTAPTPPKTISGQGAQEEKTPEQMSYDEYKKWANSRSRRR